MLPSFHLLCIKMSFKRLKLHNWGGQKFVEFEKENIFLRRELILDKEIYLEEIVHNFIINI